MSLPQVHGWLIDFRTADKIFKSKSNERIDHCVNSCQNGTLHICHFEEKNFRSNLMLSGPFILEQNRIFEPDDDIYDRCQTIAENPNGKAVLAGNEAAIFITATAAAKGLGVISDHVSTIFATVHDLCSTYGVPVLTADNYFGLL